QNAASSSAGPGIFTSWEDQTDLLCRVIPEGPTLKMCRKQFPNESSGEAAKIMAKLFRN
ncbi:hypothetical protein PANDA_012999, partial [Ailuropoda melanoleuca]